MRMWITALLGTVATLVATGALAADPEGCACALLVSGDIEAVTDAKAGALNPMDMDIPVSPTKHETMYGCLWPVAANMGQVVISMGRLPPGQTAQTLAQQNAGMDALRAKHHTAEKKDFGNASCSIMTPPVSEKDGTKALLDRAIGRLR